MLNQYVILPQVGMAARPNLRAGQVTSEVERRTGPRFHHHHHHHVEAARRLGVRAAAGKDDGTLDLRYAEYITSIKQYLYSQAWIDRLVSECSTAEGFEAATGRRAEQFPLPD